MRRLIMTLLIAAFVALPVSAFAGGNSDAKRCLDWSATQPGTTVALLQTDTGRSFTSYEDCLAYAKHARILQPSAVNDPTTLASLQTSTLHASGFHRNMPVQAYYFIEGYEMPSVHYDVTDKRGMWDLTWTLLPSCADMPEFFGAPPYDGYVLVVEGTGPHPSGVHAVALLTSIC